MNREDALEILRLDDDATISEARQRMFDLINEAQLKNKPSRISSYRNAFKVIIETEGEAMGPATHFIASDGLERQPEKLRILPYQEAVIRARIAKLPERVTVRCAVEGSPYSLEVNFDKQHNRLELWNPIRGNDWPLLGDFQLPVEYSDLEIVETVHNVEKSRDVTFERLLERSENVVEAGIHRDYSRSTSIVYKRSYVKGLGLVRNSKNFGHESTCACCNARDILKTRCCGQYVCTNHSPWPSRWPDSGEIALRIDCPHCGSPNSIYMPSPAYSRNVRLNQKVEPKPTGLLHTELVRERRQASALPAPSQERIASTPPLRQIEKKTGS